MTTKPTAVVDAYALDVVLEYFADPARCIGLNDAIAQLEEDAATNPVDWSRAEPMLDVLHAYATDDRVGLNNVDQLAAWARNYFAETSGLDLTDDRTLYTAFAVINLVSRASRNSFDNDHIDEVEAGVVRVLLKALGAALTTLRRPT